VFNPGAANSCTSHGEASSLHRAPSESETTPHVSLLGRISAQHGRPPVGTSVAWPAEAHDTPIGWGVGVGVALDLQKTNSFSSGMTPNGGSKSSRFRYGNGGPTAPSRHVLGILMFQPSNTSYIFL